MCYECLTQLFAAGAGSAGWLGAGTGSTDALIRGLQPLLQEQSYCLTQPKRPERSLTLTAEYQGHM